MADFPEESFSLRVNRSPLTIMVNPRSRLPALLYAVSTTNQILQGKLTCYRFGCHVALGLRKARVPH